MYQARKDKGVNGNNDRIPFAYAAFLVVFAATLFLYGFFPKGYSENFVSNVTDIPKFVEDVRIKIEEVYNPVVKRAVIMVIDALRWDFVAGPLGRSMPTVNSLISQDSGCLFHVKVKSPTVTMPRIKAMTTGSVPNFIDIVLNLGGKTVIGDSFLRQLKSQGKLLTFFGDDTWLDLFPDTFHRHDGTSSFFVMDFTEVDDNVTRHLNTELKKEDWSLMVLHYLGLDHIGHVAGAHSPLIPNKLREMDDVIRKIQEHLFQMNPGNVPSLLVICGDHGMRDSGGHGGATWEETSVPLVVVGVPCQTPKAPKYSEIDQIDLATTLSILFGVPIPFSNFGNIPIELMTGLTAPQKLFALYYNGKQVLRHFEKTENYKLTSAYKQYRDAVKLHVAWLDSNKGDDDTVQDIVMLYKEALQGMKEVLTNSSIKYDLDIMVIAILFLHHALYIMLSKPRSLGSNAIEFSLVFVANVCLWNGMNHFLEIPLQLPLHSSSISLKLIVFCVFTINCYYCTTRELFRCIWKRNIFSQFLHSGKIEFVFPLVALIHALSFSSSSFVEEEHQTWYFIWATFLTILFYSNVKKFAAKFSSEIHLKNTMSILILLVSHRIFRKLNSTGNKFANLPDISDWLLEDDSKIFLTFFFVTGLFLLIWLYSKEEKSKFRNFMLMLNGIMAICIYLRHMIAGNVIKIPFLNLISDPRGLLEVHLYWLLLGLSVFTDVILRIFLRKRGSNAEKNLEFTFLILIRIWVSISVMLHRPHNVILVPFQLISSAVICRIFQDRVKDKNLLLHVHIWLGNTFYFYQGNSNSLATIDVAAGYVGLSSYQPIIAGILVIINTCSAPTLAYLTLLHGFSGEKTDFEMKNKDVLEISVKYATWKLLPLAIYTTIVSIQRHHLFIWSVFSPKLLYEAAHCVFTYLFICLVLCITFVQNCAIKRKIN